MRRGLLLLSVLAIAAFGTCSKKSTPPDDNHNNPADTITSIAYVGELDSVAEQIVGAEGGSITAGDARGVTFALSIPAGALTQAMSIRMTPLASLELGGSESFVCSGCGGSDSLCCLHGILLEPEGLILDTPATLTITFPAGQFPFKNGGWIAYIDSAGPKYEICHTIGDTLNRTLVAEITHFSGYGSDDPRYDELENEIYKRIAKLESAIGTGLFHFYSNELLRLYPAFDCYGDNCSDFSDLYRVIEDALLENWSSHADYIRQNAVGPNCDALLSLETCWYELSHSATQNLSNWEEFMTLEGILLSDARAKAHFVADRGKQLCGRDSCAAGQHELNCVIGFIRRANLAEQEGPLLDSAVAWFTSCCTEKLVLTSNKTEIFDFAISEDDMSQVAVFTAQLSDALGPIPDHEVVIYCRRDDGYTFGGQGTTDESGETKIPIFMAPEGIHVKSAGEFRCYADTRVGDHWVKSDTIPLAITKRIIVMNYNYIHNVSGSYECCWSSGMLSFSGVGKIVTGGNSDCVYQKEWLITRSVDRSWGCSCPADPGSTNVRSLPKNDSLPACFYEPRFTGTWKDEPAPGYPQYLLRAVYVNWLYPIDACFLEVTIIDDNVTTVDTVDNTCYALFPDRDGVFVDSSLYTGSFSPVQWDTTIVSGPYTYSAAWMITFRLEQ